MELLIRDIEVADVIIYWNILYSAGHRILSIGFSESCGTELEKVANWARKPSWE